MTKNIYIKLAAVACLLISGAANASLIGDAIDVELTGGIELLDEGVVVGNGVEFQGGDASTAFGAFLFATESIDVGANTITMAFDTSLGQGAMLTFSDLDLGNGIEDVLFSSSIAEIVLADFTSTSLTIDMTAWFTAGGAAEITIFLVEATPVPVPGALVLMLSALGFLGVRKRTA